MFPVLSLFSTFSQQFFDGVQAKVGQGVKESEIGYQMAFSKQELRKVISIYPGREVKKGLESLYKKVEKHLSDESNLLQVPWYQITIRFISTNFKFPFASRLFGAQCKNQIKT